MKKIKLQYYLRGLGVGILVTAIVMATISTGQKKELTDAEIKRRAAELGMVDENSLVLSDLQGDQFVKVESEDATVGTEEIETEVVETEVAETEVIETEDVETESVETEVSEEVVVEDTVVEEDITEEPAIDNTGVQEQFSQPRVTGYVNEDQTTVTISVQAGADSFSVSKVLADTGLVAGAKSYDNYLCDGGYSKKIRTGNYVIAIGASEEEIAKIITGNR